MKHITRLAGPALLLTLGAGGAAADDLAGVIEAINPADGTFVVQGITFQTTSATDYDDGLRSFADLKVGQRVEVDFQYRDGRHYATEVELDD